MVSIIKESEKFKYSACRKGIVEYVSFRGKEVEAGIRIKDTL